MAVDPNVPITVGQWSVQGRAITLFLNREESRFSYLVAGTRKSEKIYDNLYFNTDQTCMITEIFKDVIAENLKTAISPSSFVPVFTSQIYKEEGGRYVPLRGKRAALFGQGNLNPKQILEARWGVSNWADHSVAIIEANVNGATRDCLFNVLCNKQSVVLYDNYVIAVATLNADQRIQSIALETLNRQRTSLYDPTVFLNENHWGITLVSSQSRTTYSEERFIRGGAGHAMIACEGMENGMPFLKYAHLTKADPTKPAVVKISTGIIGGLKGPTWARTRVAAENLLHLAEMAAHNQEQVPFVLGRQIHALATKPLAVTAIAGGVVTFGWVATALVGSSIFAPYCPAMSWFLISQVATRAIAGSLGTVAVTSAASGISAVVSRRFANCYDCLRWSLEQLPHARIQLNIPSTICTPNAAIQYLQNHPGAITLDN